MVAIEWRGVEAVLFVLHTSMSSVRQEVTLQAAAGPLVSFLVPFVLSSLGPGAGSSRGGLSLLQLAANRFLGSCTFLLTNSSNPLSEMYPAAVGFLFESLVRLLLLVSLFQ